MRRSPMLALALACTVPLATATTAQVRHRSHPTRGMQARLVHRYAPPAYGYAVAGEHGAFNAGAAQVPPRGFYDSYYGPGATVLRRGLAAQYEPGATQELEPDAKQTATGGPVGGLPGRSGP